MVPQLATFGDMMPPNADLPVRYRDRRELLVTASPAALFHTVARLGGGQGWLAWNWLWRVRGWLDRAVGGPGMRGRPGDPEGSRPLYVGEVIDVWRVEVVDAPHRLTLRAEMRVPGRAWLEFRAEPAATGTRFIQEARFAPSGLFGHLYWYAMVPAHLVLFPAMARAIADRALAFDRAVGAEERA